MYIYHYYSFFYSLLFTYKLYFSIIHLKKRLLSSCSPRSSASLQEKRESVQSRVSQSWDHSKSEIRNGRCEVEVDGFVQSTKYWIHVLLQSPWRALRIAGVVPKPAKIWEEKGGSGILSNPDLLLALPAQLESLWRRRYQFGLWRGRWQHSRRTFCQLPSLSRTWNLHPWLPVLNVL